MVTSRTGTAEHKQFRIRVLTRDRAAGITHCPICGITLDYETSRLPNSAEPDHIIPAALGGTNHVDNGRTICRRDNQSRGAKQTRPARTIEPTITNLVDW